MTDSQYVGLALVIFLAVAGIQWVTWNRLLGPSLKTPEPALRAAALKRWLVTIVITQVVGVALAVAWVAGNRSAHTTGFAWIAPAIGLVAGNAFPLQVAVLGISRSGRR